MCAKENTAVDAGGERQGRTRDAGGGSCRLLTSS